ncbi:MAG: hypothetical protein HQK60_09825 [Deltaproteobacteria bacterium]|nr:hypothetical protein [Deltaproteobacteria bacterium]
MLPAMTAAIRVQEGLTQENRKASLGTSNCKRVRNGYAQKKGLKPIWLKSLYLLVGTTGFEPATT